MLVRLIPSLTIVHGLLHADSLAVPSLRCATKYESAILSGGIHGAQWVVGGWVSRLAKAAEAVEAGHRREALTDRYAIHLEVTTMTVVVAQEVTVVPETSDEALVEVKAEDGMTVKAKDEGIVDNEVIIRAQDEDEAEEAAVSLVGAEVNVAALVVAQGATVTSVAAEERAEAVVVGIEVAGAVVRNGAAFLMRRWRQSWVNRGKSDDVEGSIEQELMVNAANIESMWEEHGLSDVDEDPESNLNYNIVHVVMHKADGSK